MTKAEEKYAQDGLTCAPPAPAPSGGYPDQLDRLAETFGEPALVAGTSGLADHAAEADVVPENFGWTWVPGQLTPEQWRASELRCPCGFATDDVKEFDGHLVATAEWKPEHFEIAGEWTLERVRQWQASA